MCNGSWDNIRRDEESDGDLTGEDRAKEGGAEDARDCYRVSLAVYDGVVRSRGLLMVASSRAA